MPKVQRQAIRNQRKRVPEQARRLSVRELGTCAASFEFNRLNSCRRFSALDLKLTVKPLEVISSEANGFTTSETGETIVKRCDFEANLKVVFLTSRRRERVRLKCVATLEGSVVEARLPYESGKITAIRETGCEFRLEFEGLEAFSSHIQTRYEVFAERPSHISLEFRIGECEHSETSSTLVLLAELKTVEGRVIEVRMATSNGTEGE